MIREEWWAFVSVFSFFTRLPLKPKVFSLERGILYLPLVSLSLGALSYLLIHLFNHFLDPLWLSFLILIFVYYLADYFHFDGLLDTVDALSVHGDREKRLKILKTPEVGVLGFLFGFFFLLGEFLLVRSLLIRGAILALCARPFFGRQALALLSYLGRPAKQEGLGASFLASSRSRFFKLQVLWLPMFWFFPLESLLVVILVVYLKYKFEREFGGLTGDLLGASVMLSQWVFLAAHLFLGSRFRAW